ncbi:MAG: GNAT family N-acetyltransferase [bacterium]
MPGQQNIIPDDWLSEILARRVYRLVPDDEFVKKARNSASAEHARLRRLMDSKPVFFYARVALEAIDAITFLEEQGFHLIETNVSLERPSAPPPSVSRDCDVRFAEAEDEAQTVELGRKAFRFARFHLDSHFSTAMADRIKAEWVRNYFKGKRGEYMVVAVKDGRVTGFLQLLQNPDGVLTIDLIGVDQRYRRQGIARNMIAFAMTHCPHSTMTVGTQMVNIASIRLYEEMGFRMDSARYVFHFHNDL